TAAPALAPSSSQLRWSWVSWWRRSCPAAGVQRGTQRPLSAPRGMQRCLPRRWRASGLGSRGEAPGAGVSGGARAPPDKTGGGAGAVRQPFETVRSTDYGLEPSDLCVREIEVVLPRLAIVADLPS